MLVVPGQRTDGYKDTIQEETKGGKNPFLQISHCFSFREGTQWEDYAYYSVFLFFIIF